MDLPMDALLARLRADRGYRGAFRRAFLDGVTAPNLARALASYLRTIRSGNSPVDRYRAGDTAALSLAARRGLAVFMGRANCATCHLGAGFTDERFHNTGVAAGSGDLGRYGVSGREEDRGAFKTPTLREVARSAPYMHDGSLPTLEEVVAFYDRGGVPNARLDPEIRPLGLSPQEKQDLLAFLRALGSGSTAGPPSPFPGPD